MALPDYLDLLSFKLPLIYTQNIIFRVKLRLLKVQMNQTKVHVYFRIMQVQVYATAWETRNVTRFTSWRMSAHGWRKHMVSIRYGLWLVCWYYLNSIELSYKSIFKSPLFFGILPSLDVVQIFYSRLLNFFFPSPYSFLSRNQTFVFWINGLHYS